MGALGLVVNAAVLWNTFYMQDALDHLRKNGIPVSDSDIAGLSPLRYEHINELGRSRWSMRCWRGNTTGEPDFYSEWRRVEVMFNSDSVKKRHVLTN